MSLDEAFNWAIKMHPDELQGLTNGAVNPIGDLKTGAWQAPVRAIEGTRKVFKAFREIPPVLMKQGLGLLIAPPEIVVEEERKKREKQDKYKFIS